MTNRPASQAQVAEMTDVIATKTRKPSQFETSGTSTNALTRLQMLHWLCGKPGRGIKNSPERIARDFCTAQFIVL